MEPFLEIDESVIRRERDKARELRKSNWWKNKLAQGNCHYCSGQFKTAELTMDHLVPVSRGGRSTRGNCVPACKECNNLKKNLLPLEWDAYLKRLGQDSEDSG